jgi:outer membrane protein
MTSSLVREAGVRLEKAMLEREQEERKTERAARAAYQSVETSASMLEALRKAVIAQDSALQTRQEGYKAGVASVVAVADAYRLYYSARRDYLQARYDYLVNRLKLKQAVGALSRDDLVDLADLMQ